MHAHMQDSGKGTMGVYLCDYLVGPSIPSGIRYKICETLTDHCHSAWYMPVGNMHPHLPRFNVYSVYVRD